MPYDPTKDQLLWEAPTSPQGLIVQIKSYNGADPKIRTMKTFTKRDQSVETRPAYGLTLEDFVYIGQFWEQIKQVIMQTRNSQPNQGGFQNPNQGFGGSFSELSYRYIKVYQS